MSFAQSTTARLATASLIALLGGLALVSAGGQGHATSLRADGTVTAPATATPTPSPSVTPNEQKWG